MQYLPLQRVGVLKFVQQHMLVAAIQLVLHVLGAIAPVEQAAYLPFQIGEIHLLRAQLQFLVVFQQRRAAMQRGPVHAQGVAFGQRIAHRLQLAEQYVARQQEGFRILFFGRFETARLIGLGI